MQLLRNTLVPSVTILGEYRWLLPAPGLCNSHLFSQELVRDENYTVKAMWSTRLCQVLSGAYGLSGGGVCEL